MEGGEWQLRAEIADLQAALTAAQEREAKLREALRSCLKLVDEDLDEQGDDHSVGICMCDWVEASRVAHELLGN